MSNIFETTKKQIEGSANTNVIVSMLKFSTPYEKLTRINFLAVDGSATILRQVITEQGTEKQVIDNYCQQYKYNII